MSRYLPYRPEQDWLLPPSVAAELGEGHLAVFLHQLVGRLDLRQFEDASDHGRPGYPPQMLLRVWLYAYATGTTSSRRIEQRIVEDLGYRYLAGGLRPDFWTLNQFRKRYPKALNDVFTQVVEAARQMGHARLGRVAIDSTRVQANASPDRSDSVAQLRRERARIRQRIRRWQKQCDTEGEGERAGVPAQYRAERLMEIPPQLEQLRKSGQKRSSRTDPESRYLRKRGGFVLGYTAEVAVSDDHLIVAQRVHQAVNDTDSLAAMTDAVTEVCGASPQAVVADSGYYSQPTLTALEQRHIPAYVPDPRQARELAGQLPEIAMNARQQQRHPGLDQRRQWLRSPQARQIYQRRKAVVEPVLGVLKQQRNLRQFRCRGLARVATEWTLATTAFNLTRLFVLQKAT